MIKIPSLHTITSQLTSTVRRFPWVVTLLICKAAVLWRHIESAGNEEELNLMTRMAYPLFLATPLTIAIQLIAERKQWSIPLKTGINLLIVSILAFYFFTLAEKPAPGDFYRFMLFMVASHLFVAYSAFLGKGKSNGFWQLNKTFFLQFLGATLYAVTLYIGLLIAVKTVEYLFNITYLFKIEGDLFVLIAVVFHTLFFLSKIPANLSDIDEDTSYPTGLKIFTQYVLLPLEVVYMVILYAYMLRIIFKWELPQGGVAYLVVAFSVAGILALLLLYPLRELAREKWVRLFSLRFYFALLPLIVLLFIGVFRRINDYGITENRYIVAVLAFWLAVTTIYFLVSKIKDIRLIPISLSVIALLLAIGPWNIFAVARNSQINAFGEILAKNKLLNAEDKVAGKAAVTAEEYKQLKSIIQFFRKRKQAGLEKYFTGLKTKYGMDFQHFDQMDELLAEHISNSSDDLGRNGNYVSFSSRSLESDSSTVPITNLNQLKFFALNETTHLKTHSLTMGVSAKGRFINIYKNGSKLKTWDLSEKIRMLKSDFGTFSDKVPANALTLRYTTATEDITISFSSVNQSGDYYYGEGVLVFK